MNPIKTAALISGCYFVPSLLYIFISTRITAGVAASPEDAMLIELIKGSIFVLLSALLIFAVTWKAIAVIRHRELERNRLNDSLLQFDRRSTTGLLAASIAHDAGNEIAVLTANLDALRTKTQDNDELADIVDDQRMALKRLNQLTDRLIDAAKTSDDYSPKELDLVARSRHILQSLEQHSRLRDIKLNFQPSADSCPIQASPGLIRQILINLLFNAADAAGDGGQVALFLNDEGDSVCVEVHDDGPGVDDDTREHLFDAFYTTKEHGTGLGLFSVRACLRLQGGSIEVGDSHLGGAVFRITLPKSPPSSPDNIPALSQITPSLSSSLNFAG